MGILTKTLSCICWLSLVSQNVIGINANVLNFMNNNGRELIFTFADEPTATGRHWGYEGLNGPEYWGDINENFKLCKTGRNQSPINLSKQHLKNLSSEILHFNYQQNVTASYEMINNGHSVQINIPEEAKNTFTHDGIEYTLRQFHFHAPSEHHIENHDTPFEVHFVHTTKDNSGATQFHVVGLFAKFGKGDYFIDQFIENLKEVEVVGTKKEFNKLYIPDLNDFFNESELVWKYNGSLTTPPCSEGVKWLVSSKVLTINVEQLLAFQNVMPFNARPTRLNENVLKEN